MTSDFTLANAPDDTTDLSDLREELLRAIAERKDYALRGAWRAGYDYVHVYQPIAPGALAREPLDEFTVQADILWPSNVEEPPGGIGNYLYTYDLTAVSDAEIREGDAVGE